MLDTAALTPPTINLWRVLGFRGRGGVGMTKITSRKVNEVKNFEKLLETANQIFVDYSVI